MDVLFSFSRLFPSNEPLDFRSFFKYFHNQRNKESLLAHTAEDLEAYVNAWANKFVDTNLCPHLASWLLELENAYPEELPKLKAHLGKTSFTAMGVTKNYVSAAHTDRDVLHSLISWFIQGIVYFPSVFLVFSLLLVLFQVHSVFV